MACKVINEMGNRHGRLTVLRRDGFSKGRQAMWRCLCDCGNEVTVSGTELRRNHTRSCGCLRAETTGNRCRLPEGVAAFNDLVGKMKRSAKLRGYDWDLTKEQVRELTSQSCYYCGKAPMQILRHKDWNGNYVYNGLDRVDNDKGYTIENVVPCCGACNRAKFKMTKIEFLQWIERVYWYSRNI